MGLASTLIGARCGEKKLLSPMHGGAWGILGGDWWTVGASRTWRWSAAQSAGGRGGDTRLRSACGGAGTRQRLGAGG